jgi:hypothetical protein
MEIGDDQYSPSDRHIDVEKVGDVARDSQSAYRRYYGHPLWIGYWRASRPRP